LEDLQVDKNTFTRMTCCGKAIHRHCEDDFFGSSLSREQKSKCPHCQKKFISTDEEDFELARGWADKGKAWAQASLANKYRFGGGVEQSYEKAIEYCTLAIQQDDPNAMFDLAAMYARGEGVTKSFEKAIELYTQAANQGHANAQFNLGCMYYNGEGVDQSNELAREWFIKAAVQDQQHALQLLQQLDKHEGRTTPTILCCSNCGKPKTPTRPLKPCKLCHTVQYCGRECQVNHWKKGGHRRDCRTLREAAAAAAAAKKTVPMKKEEDSVNDTKQEATTTSATTSTSTTTTTTSSPPTPQNDEASNATKSKSKENNDDGFDKKDKKETTTTSPSSTTPTSSSSSPLLPRQADTCCVCLEDLQVDSHTFDRMTCCGKATHKHCRVRFFGSGLSREQKSKCPHCQVKLPSTVEEGFELALGWADKGKAWAQSTLGDLYKFGRGVEQSYEKAIEYFTLAIQKGEPNAIFGLAVMYHRGEGVTKSIKKAVELYTRAANQGHASAQFTLGVLHYQGSVADQSNELARAWWIKAAVQDEENALKALQDLDQMEGRTTPTILCCSTCGKPKTPLRPMHPCKLCHTVQYCGRECQVNHWKKGGHRRECKTLREAAAAKAEPKEVCGINN
jgi:TPR repeat protein